MVSKKEYKNDAHHHAYYNYYAEHSLFIEHKIFQMYKKCRLKLFTGDFVIEKHPLAIFLMHLSKEYGYTCKRSV